MNRVIVTGGAGFIGSHLAEALANRGYHVTILDDLSTGKRENITGLLAKGDTEFVEGSITDLSRLQQICSGAEYVFHLAALARVPRSIEDPLSANEVNIKGTLNVLLASRDSGVRKVIYASSSSIYGNNSVSAQVEDMPPNPLSPYALGKLAGEYYCNIFRQTYGLPTVCLRYFNVYGPKQDFNSPYATAGITFINRISGDLPPVIYGDGEQSRDFTFVEDVVAANLLAMENEATGVYNIGSGKSATINQLARTIAYLLGKNLQPVYQKPRPGDPRHTLADISRARSLGYEPKWTLELGLRKTIDWYRQLNTVQ